MGDGMYGVELTQGKRSLEELIDSTLAGEDVLLHVCDGVAVKLEPVEALYRLELNCDVD